MPEELGEAIQLMIEQGYREFLERVAMSRDMTTEEVDQVAQGRVWSGEDAHRLGLVDGLGGLQTAIREAQGVVIAIVDSDGQADVGDLPRFLERLDDLPRQGGAITFRGACRGDPALAAA